jgi:hypothetical protein
MSNVNVLAGTRAGVGYSEKASGREAGAEAARDALAQAGLDTCDLVLLFATGKQDPAAVRDGVRSVVGDRARLIGGATVGIITGDRYGFEGHQVGVAVLQSDRLRVDLFLETDLSDREYNAGRGLGRQIRAAYPDGQPAGLLLLYDIVKNTIGGDLNLATPLLAGMTDSLGTWPTTAGGGLMGNLQFSQCFQFVDDRIVSRALTGLALDGPVRMDTIIMHGCRPSGRYYTITKAEGNIVLELDGQPAAEVISRMLGPDTDRSTWADYPIFITLGINNGDKFGEYNEDDYAVRLCSAVDAERGGLAFFGDDLQKGREVRLMRRSIDMQYMRPRVDELRARLAGRRPILALYVDCAGRCSAMSGSDGEEAFEIQKALGAEMPLLGWYTGGEIARSGGVMQSHNYTGILSILSEPAELSPDAAPS